MSLEINYNKQTKKNCKINTHTRITWKLNNVLLHYQWITDKIKKYLETNKNKNTAMQNLWDA